MSHFHNMSNCILKFGNNTQALVISKRLKLPWDDQTDIKFYSAAWNDF